MLLRDYCWEVDDMYELGVQEHALVQFLKVADENSFVLESRDLPYVNAEECRNVLRDAYKDYIGLIHQRMSVGF